MIYSIFSFRSPYGPTTVLAPPTSYHIFFLYFGFYNPLSPVSTVYNKHGCEAIHWSMGKLSEPYPQNRTMPYPEQLSNVSSFSVESGSCRSSVSYKTRFLLAFWTLCLSHTSKHSCCEFMRGMFRRQHPSTLPRPLALTFFLLLL